MNEYEKLIRKGYREEEIDLPLDEVSRISISDNPLGPGREDKGVIAKDSAGVEKKTSSIMMGYNKKGIRLETGEYVSAEELEQALDVALKTDEENIIYACRRTGKIVEVDSIMEDLLDSAMKKSYLTHTPTEKITNQQAASVTIHDRGKEYPKGIAMLGNDNLQLPSGDYVKEEEIIRAIEDYVILHEPEKEIPITPPKIIPAPIVTNPQEPTQTPRSTTPKPNSELGKEATGEESYVVIKRIFHKPSVIPALVATAMIILSGFGKTPTTDIVEHRSNIQNLNVEAAQVQYEKEYESSEDVAKRLLGDFVTGGQVEVKEGTPYYASSDYEYGGNDQRGIFGDGLRSIGAYMRIIFQF